MTTEKTEEELEKQAETEMSAGFNKVHGTTSPDAEPESEATIKPDEEEVEEKPEEVTQETEKKPDPTPQPTIEDLQESIAALQKQSRDQGGTIGGLKQQLKEAKKPAPKPSETQILSALKDPKALDAIVTEFGQEFQPLVDELKAVRTDLAASSNNDDLRNEISDLRSQAQQDQSAARELAKLDIAHSDWDEVGHSDEFTDWVLTDGPSQEQYNEFTDLEKTAPAEATEMENRWARDYPQWWADRGVGLVSASADGLITLLNSFKDKQKTTAAEAGKSAEEETARLKKEKADERLAAATPAEGTSGTSAKELSDAALYSKGFKKVRRVGAASM